ncbi:MAG: hypothetical protein WCA85_20995 [Paraburkholderia sp.]|uniref:hypothetical protein n=1 Tax=Paraburkholderia sp. TaxID=1926495 RepID=UPI003C54E1C1
MSHSAEHLIELMRLARGGGGALTQHLLREVAMSILSPGPDGEGGHGANATGALVFH